MIAVHKPAYNLKTRMVADLGPPLKRAFQEVFDASLAEWDDPRRGAAATARAGRPSAIARCSRTSTQLGSSGSSRFTSGGPISPCGVGPEGWMQLNRVIANASVTKIVSGRSGLSLVTFNDHSHFEGER